jgi:hypothetical protein
MERIEGEVVREERRKGKFANLEREERLENEIFLGQSKINISFDAQLPNCPCLTRVLNGTDTFPVFC